MGFPNMSTTPSKEDTVRRFSELAKEFDSLRAGGDELLLLAQNLIALAFRDMHCNATGGGVVPQLGQGAGKELSFELPQSNCLENQLQQARDFAVAFWKAGDVDKASLNLDSSDASASLVCVAHTIASGFDKPIGYFWTVVHSDDVTAADNRLQYVTKYFATAVRAEKACNAIELLSDPTCITRSHFDEAANVLAESCRKALSASAVIVWVADRVRDSLRTVASADGKGTRVRIDMNFDQGIAGKCVTKCFSIIVDDLLDDAELQRIGASVYNPELVKQRGWRSAIFVPLDIGGEAAGVMSAYGIRPRGFSLIDKYILLAFAHRLSASLANFERIRQLTEMERRLEVEAPSIEAGMLAMENVHDSVNALTRAQDCLTTASTDLIPDKHGRLYAEISASRSLVTTAKKGIAALANRAKFQKIILSRVVLKEILEEAVRKVKPSADDQRIHIELSCPSDLVLHLDKEKMHRVIVNLLENSIWFLEHDTKPGESRIEVRANSTDAAVVISVKDNGPGIAPYDLKKVFDYFFTTKGDRGMGFGLAIARRIIAAHGGTLKALSEWGYSTEMVIELPTSLRKEDKHDK